MNTLERIKRLERIVKESAGKFVYVTFADGTSKKLKAPDAISLLRAPDVDSIIDISGESGGGNGLLVELERGLIQE